MIHLSLFVGGPSEIFRTTWRVIPFGKLAGFTGVTKWDDPPTKGFTQYESTLFIGVTPKIDQHDDKLHKMTLKIVFFPIHR